MSICQHCINGTLLITSHFSVFLTEVVDSLKRGFDDKLNCENLVLEINSSRYAYNVTVREVITSKCCRLTIIAFLSGESQRRKSNSNVASAVCSRHFIFAFTRSLFVLFCANLQELYSKRYCNGRLFGCNWGTTCTSLYLCIALLNDYSFVGSCNFFC